jgi:peroxiredoxin family protein
MSDTSELTSYAEQFGQEAANGEQDDRLERLLVILSKGSMEDAYAALVMANGAVMEGSETHMFFTFFGLDAITKDKQDKLHMPTVGNPALMRNVPTMVVGLPGMEALATKMMRGKMEEHDVPPVSEFLEMVVAGGLGLGGQSGGPGAPGRSWRVPWSGGLSPRHPLTHSVSPGHPFR